MIRRAGSTRSLDGDAVLVAAAAPVQLVARAERVAPAIRFARSSRPSMRVRLGAPTRRQHGALQSCGRSSGQTRPVPERRARDGVAAAVAVAAATRIR